MKELIEAGALKCANCATPMQGEFCHHCGQSIHSVLKPMHHMLEDGADMFLHVDSRILRTLPPLLLKPGLLTLDYFAGRRIRYIAPFRLMFVLCLLAFFAFHLAVEKVADRIEARTQENSTQVNGRAFDDDDTAADVRHDLADQLADLAESRRVPGLPAVAISGIDKAGYALRQQANHRLLTLGAAPMPAASLAPPVAPASVTAVPPVNEAAKPPAGAGDDSAHAPMQVAWLPDFVNVRLTRLAEHLRANWHAYRHGDETTSQDAKERMLAGIFGVLPQAMIVMIPLFALLLKLFYVFRRRLYMEHLIVALHSHAFLFLSLLLIAAAGMLSTWLKPHAAWIGWTMDRVQVALMLWMPIYLLLMQKFVYRQGWPMTVFKYWVVGWCYLWLLGIALLCALLLGMAH